MRLGEVGADGKDALRVLQVQQVVGHGSGAEGRAEADDSRRMAEPGAVVHIGRAQQAGHLLHEIVLLVVAAGGGQEAQGFRTVLSDVLSIRPWATRSRASSQEIRTNPSPTFFMGYFSRSSWFEDLQDGVALGAERALAGGVVGHVFYADGSALIHDQVEAAAYSAVGAEGRNLLCGHNRSSDGGLLIKGRLHGNGRLKAGLRNICTAGVRLPARPILFAVMAILPGFSIWRPLSVADDGFGRDWERIGQAVAGFRR